jgi:hypothetical protein
VCGSDDLSGAERNPKPSLESAITTCPTLAAHVQKNDVPMEIARNRSIGNFALYWIVTARCRSL